MVDKPPVATPAPTRITSYNVCYTKLLRLHYSAKYIVNELKGEFPKNFKELKKLKGVGDYTAAAIASFAFV